MGRLPFRRSSLRPARRQPKRVSVAPLVALLGAVMLSAHADPSPDPSPYPSPGLSPEASQESPPQLLAVAVRGPPGPPAEGDVVDIPSAEELEAMRAQIGSVAIDVDEIFDESDPRENKLLYRLANDLHLATRESTVRDRLLFRSGEPFSAQKAEETARLLRAANFLSDAEVTPTRYDPASNTVDVKVRVRDVWTFEPGVGVGRSGGSNKTRMRLADENLFGLGQEIALEYKSDEDRSGLGLQFHDPNVLHSWWALDTKYTDTSDGSIASLSFARPFYSLNSRWSAGLAFETVDEVTSLYDLGEPINDFESSYDSFAIQGGRSQGLVDGWTFRWIAGYRYDRARFAPAEDDGDVPSLVVPADRLLSYPWGGIELVQDHYRTTQNQDQIGRTEDVFLGERLLATFGWAAPALGSDRSAGIFSVEGELGRPFGENDTLLADARWSGRLEGGSLADALLEANAHYYHRFDEKNLFVASLEGAQGSNLDLDHPVYLGGDNGLRGYPLRYQAGTTRALATVEQRYFTDWYPFRLLRVGGAVFADVGRTWGDATLASESQGWLGDVGFGLRLGNARSGTGSVLHVDLAFPLAGSQDIESVQLLLEAQHSF